MQNVHGTNPIDASDVVVIGNDSTFYYNITRCIVLIRQPVVCVLCSWEGI